MTTIASSTSRLERAIDEYHYALSVDWDQKDQIIFQKMTDEFLAEMGKIIASEGLTKEQVLAVAEKKMNNKRQFEALKMKLALVSKVDNVQEIGAIVRESVRDMYSRGASWNGGVISTELVIILLILAAAGSYSYWFDKNHECVKSSQSYSCWMNCNHWGACLEECGMKDECVEYERI